MKIFWVLSVGEILISGYLCHETPLSPIRYHNIYHYLMHMSLNIYIMDKILINDTVKSINISLKLHWNVSSWTAQV